MKSFMAFLLIIVSQSILAQITSTGQLLDAMQSKNRSNWFETFTFEQQTIRYNSDRSIRDTAIWNEAIRYPDQFRIDYAEPGSYVIFRKDSAYRFVSDLQQSVAYEPQEFLLFKGGM